MVRVSDSYVLSGIKGKLNELPFIFLCFLYDISPETLILGESSDKFGLNFSPECVGIGLSGSCLGSGKWAG